MRCIALYSGGLDSLLAIRIIEFQKIEVIPVIFESYFFSAKKALGIAKKNSISPVVLNISDKHLSIVKSPFAGYGKFLNPCIDCHALMIKEAFKFMMENNASFLVTGEVLNERPFSQTPEGLRKIDNLTGLSDITLRPLSAKLLRETKPEREKWVDRGKLYDIQGRTRRRQMELAKIYNIKAYEQPAGGCILTDEKFCKRLKPFLDEIKGKEIKLFFIGRHFLYNGSHIIIGRNERENLLIEKEDYIYFKMLKEPGPTGLFRVLKDYSHKEFAAKLILRYANEKNGEIFFSDGTTIYTEVCDIEYLEKYLIR